MAVTADPSLLAKEFFAMKNSRFTRGILLVILTLMLIPLKDWRVWEICHTAIGYPCLSLDCQISTRQKLYALPLLSPVFHFLGQPAHYRPLFALTHLRHPRSNLLAQARQPDTARMIKYATPALIAWIMSILPKYPCGIPGAARMATERETMMLMINHIAAIHPTICMATYPCVSAPSTFTHARRITFSSMINPG